MLRGVVHHQHPQRSIGVCRRARQQLHAESDPQAVDRVGVVSLPVDGAGPSIPVGVLAVDPQGDDPRGRGTDSEVKTIEQHPPEPGFVGHDPARHGGQVRRFDKHALAFRRRLHLGNRVRDELRQIKSISHGAMTPLHTPSPHGSGAGTGYQPAS